MPSSWRYSEICGELIALASWLIAPDALDSSQANVFALERVCVCVCACCDSFKKGKEEVVSLTSDSRKGRVNVKGVQ